MTAVKPGTSVKSGGNPIGAQADADAPRALSPAAQRALAEAEARRAAEAQSGAEPEPAGQNSDVPEIGGPSGPEPTRYGDWEKAGRASDF